jgi:hypothetical protein
MATGLPCLQQARLPRVYLFNRLRAGRRPDGFIGFVSDGSPDTITGGGSKRLPEPEEGDGKRLPEPEEGDAIYNFPAK